MKRKDKLKIINDYIAQNGKLLTVNNGMQLDIDKSPNLSDDEYWKDSTINVIVIGHAGVGSAYFVQSRKVWMFSGLAIFDVPWNPKIKKQLSSAKFISREEYASIKFN